MSQERVLILGATSLIAQHVARIYAARGARLHLVARNPEKLAAVCASLAGNGADTAAIPALTSQTADLDVTHAADALIATAWDTLGGIDVAVIAHGALGDQLGTEKDWGQAEAVLRTNFLSAVALLIPLANRMEEAGRGHLAVMTSVAGERGRPRNYTYGAAKGALTVYLQGMRTRLWQRGVRVSSLKIGPTDTPMTATHAKNMLFARPEDVAAGLVHAVDRGGGEVYLPWFWRWIIMGVRHAPERLVQRLAFLSGR